MYINEGENNTVTLLKKLKPERITDLRSLNCQVMLFNSSINLKCHEEVFGNNFKGAVYELSKTYQELQKNAFDS